LSPRHFFAFPATSDRKTLDPQFPAYLIPAHPKSASTNYSSSPPTIIFPHTGPPKGPPWQIVHATKSLTTQKLRSEDFCILQTLVRRLNSGLKLRTQPITVGPSPTPNLVDVLPTSYPLTYLPNRHPPGLPDHSLPDAFPVTTNSLPATFQRWDGQNHTQFGAFSTSGTYNNLFLWYV